MSNTFRLTLVILMPIVVLAALSLAAESREVEQKVGLQTDVSAALAAGEATGTPTLLYFTADWCPPCQQMKKTTWVDDDVVAALESYTPVMVDIDAQPDLSASYGIQSIPTVILMSPEGEKVGQVVGFVEADALVSMLAEHTSE